MALKTYGELKYVSELDQWQIVSAQPHVCIKLKAVFENLQKTSTVPFCFPNTLSRCTDILWFIDRYPLAISQSDLQHLNSQAAKHTDLINEMEAILLPDYHPSTDNKFNFSEPRGYQVKANELLLKTKQLLLGDDLGLGKTVTGILGLLNPGVLPAVVVCQSHLATHWVDQIAQFTDLTTHVVTKRKSYSLPKVDVYIFAYTRLQGWVDVFGDGFFKSVIFDEISELRHSGTEKYRASQKLVENTSQSLGLSATPIYNYGDEIWTILNLLKPNALGSYQEFCREWCGGSFMKPRVTDPQALGTYLRDNYLFLRRTRAEVGMELPRVNTIVHEVEYDDEAVNDEMDLLHSLAVKFSTGSFAERGEAAREIDIRMRQITGVSKAVYVAEFTKILLENDEAVLLAGWHRAVYDIWADCFAKYNPCWFTGYESTKQKNRSRESFMNGDTNLMIISLRSGIGLDGLQKRCSNVVIGELDYSPKVHEQLIARIDRPGQTKPVTAFYPVSSGGSDPAIINVLGLKASQSHGIVNPEEELVGQYSDESRIKAMAENILSKGKYLTNQLKTA